MKEIPAAILSLKDLASLRGGRNPFVDHGATRPGNGDQDTQILRIQMIRPICC